MMWHEMEKSFLCSHSISISAKCGRLEHLIFCTTHKITHKINTKEHKQKNTPNKCAVSSKPVPV